MDQSEDLSHHTNLNINIPRVEEEEDVLFYQFLHNNPGAWELYNMVLQRKEADNKIRLKSSKTPECGAEQTVPPTPRANIMTNDSIPLSARKSSGFFKRESKTDLTQSLTPKSARKSWFKSDTQKVSTESAPADLPAMIKSPVEELDSNLHISTNINKLVRSESESKSTSSLSSRFSTHEGVAPVKRRSRRSVDKRKKKGERADEDLGPPPPNFIPDPPPPEIIAEELPRPKKSHTDSYSLFSSLVNLSSGIDIGSKNWHMKTYRQVFMANKVVDWIMENLHVPRPTATQLGYELQTSGFIEGVVRGTIFKDDKLMFQLTEKGKTILKEQDFIYFTKAFDTVNGIVIKDRSGHFKKLKGCFTGEEFVTWFVENGLVPTRERACRLGREFLETHLIEHVLKEQHFKDATLFYHLTKEGLLLLKNQGVNSQSQLNRAASSSHLKRKQNDKTKDINDPASLSMDVSPRPHSVSEPRKKASMEISQSNLNISKDVQVKKTSTNSTKKREKKSSTKSETEYLHLPASLTKPKSRSNSMSRHKTEPTVPEEPGNSPRLDQSIEKKKVESHGRVPSESKHKTDLGTESAPCVKFQIGHDRKKSELKITDQLATENSRTDEINNNKSLSVKIKEPESTLKSAKPTIASKRKPSPNNTNNISGIQNQSAVKIPDTIPSTPELFPEPDHSKLLSVPQKPKPPVNRRLPKRYTRSSKDITSSNNTKETFFESSRLTMKRLTRKRSYENGLDKENISVTELDSDTCGGESHANTFFKIPLSSSNQYNNWTSQDSMKTLSSVPSNLSDLQTEDNNNTIEEQHFSIIIRRFNRRGGVRIIVPDTLEELFNLANAKLKVSGVRLREIETEAEISDIRLFKPDQCIWLTTAEDEKEFT